ncbi:MAG: heme ABC exporter ATP-binding protein CcmA [Candidatus Acidiferrum sp.]
MTLRGFSPVGLQFENIEKRYGGLLALRGVSLSIAPGECVVVAGRNGSGKTTLLRVAAKLVRPSRGTLHFSGDSANPDAPDVRPGFVAHATMVYDELTAEENLLLFARLLGVTQARKRVDALLDEVGLAERRASLVRTFSRGMRQRVAIARALLHEPAIFLMDEPATGLDPQGVAWLAEALRRLRDSGRTILMSLHGESEISALGTRAVRLDGGAVAADTRTGATFRSILTFADA